jgi:hypothetical protein
MCQANDCDDDSLIAVQIIFLDEFNKPAAEEAPP